MEEFSQLQRFKVQRVLLVCSDYDSYTFEEDGCALLPLRTCRSPHLHVTPACSVLVLR